MHGVTDAGSIDIESEVRREGWRDETVCAGLHRVCVDEAANHIETEDDMAWEAC